MSGPDATVACGLHQTLRDLALGNVQDACDAALASFPDTAAVLKHACAALRLLRQADSAPETRHKLQRKEQQLTRVIHVAAGIDAHFTLQDDVLHPGDTTTFTREVFAETGDVTATPILPPGWSANGAALSLDSTATISDPYPATYLPGQPNAPCVGVTLTVEGMSVTANMAFEVPPVIAPQRAAAVTPDTGLINLAHDRRSVVIAVRDISPPDAKPGLRTPDGWTVTSDGSFIVTAPNDVSPGLYDIALKLGGDDAQSVRHIRRPHITPRALVRPALTQVRVVDAKLPEVRVGYIGGGHDRVCIWLDRMGAQVTDLSNVDLNDATLAACDTLVIGIFAMKFRPGLAEAIPRIHNWIHDGGTLVTLYHRPWDNWDPDTTAPHRLQIGQPSLRWRVTDASAAVTVLTPDHALLNTPNQIGPADWAGWHKERGLYFAKSWDPAYRPLVAMNDAGEAPLHGALLAADVGKGRHVHTALILHHQMEKLTPGAFRLMANLLAKRS